MASSSRPQSGQGQSGGPRRLGQQPARSGGGRQNANHRPGNGPARRQSGAQRRYDRSRQHRTNWVGWAAVAVVLIALGTILAIRFTSSSSSSSSSKSGAVTGADRNPAPAPAAEVKAITTIPASVFNSVGTAGQPVPFSVTAKQPTLTSGGKPRLVYEGGEYCPYCAVTRYAMVAALSRFGTFSNLKETASGPSDGDIPTFSFVGASYSSKYVAFSPYEAADRKGNPLMKVPAQVSALYTKYDGNPNTGKASKFANGNWSQPGIPFLDLANRFVVAGTSPGLYQVVASGVLTNGGPGRQAIANAIHDPTSPTGKSIQASQFIAEANYLTGGICLSDGAKPSSVCASPGVKAAISALAKAKKVS